jgi:hypothetical protein
MNLAALVQCLAGEKKVLTIAEGAKTANKPNKETLKRAGVKKKILKMKMSVPIIEEAAWAVKKQAEEEL